MSDQGNQPATGILSGQQNATTQQTPAQTGFLSALVGSGQKYADAEQLAKGYAHLDAHRATLEAELAALRQKAESAASVDDVLQALKQQQAGQQPTQTQVPPQGQSDPLATVDIAQIVDKVLQGKTATANKAEAERLLVATYGDKAAEVFGKVAGSPAVKEAILKVAETDPQQFITLVSGLAGNVQPPPAAGLAVGGQQSAPVNTTSGPQPGTQAWYNNLRKTDIKKYLSVEIQQQMLRDAKTDPKKYYGRQ